MSNHEDQRRNERDSRLPAPPDCMHDPSLVARHEAMLATLGTTMNDFIARSIEDRKACEERYAMDRQESREFRQIVRDRLEVIERFIEGLKPDHKMLMILAMGIIVGSLSLVWRLVWTRIDWK